MAKQTDGKDLASSIFNDISKRILSLDLEPGQEISENGICEHYEASRTPVKTALNRLRDEGFIFMSPYRQMHVKRINVDETLQYMYGRVAIETRIIRDFLRQGSPLLLEDVAHMIRKQEIVASHGPVDVMEFHELDVAFHETWYKAMDKPRLFRQLKENMDYIRLKILDYKRIQEYETIIGEHRAIYECIRQRDEERLPVVLKTHIWDHIASLIEHSRKEKDYFI